MPSLDVTKVTAGFRGAFYLAGVKYAECQGWSVKRTSKRTEEQVLDDNLDYSILQSVSYTLEFDEITIKHLLPQQVLAADLNKSDIAFSFIGEIHRADNAVGRVIASQAYPSNDFPMMGTMVGQTMKAKYQFVLNALPVLDAVLS